MRPAERALLLDGRPAVLGARAFDLLLALIERRHRLVPKDELMHAVWRGLVVTEGSLHTQVSTLRALLGNEAIATISGRGYRFAVELDTEPPVPEAEGVHTPEYRFGNCELRPRQRSLHVDGQPVRPGSRALDLLLALIERRDRVVGKNELLDVVWPGVVVEEHNLQTHISALRKLLGPQVLQTIPGRGYRFVARLEGELGASDAPQHVSERMPRLGMKSNLPVELPALFGRDDDLRALEAELDRHRLITLVGAGGVGKTLFAQHLLHARVGIYPHGVCWIELAAVSGAAALPGTIAAALGVHVGTGDPLASLIQAVEPLDMLVVLDNAEHLLADVGRLCTDLHDAARGLRLVVTSQAPLKQAAERVVRIGPLAVPGQLMPAAEALAFGAIALFADRARAVDAHFALTDADAPAVIGVCRALDGLPLAIELAAARAPMLSVHRLLASMHDRFSLLTTSRNRAAPPRQQTLRAALEWSHGFLDVRERAVFRRLGVIVGSSSLELVQRMVVDPPGEGDLDQWAVLDALGLLIDRSMVVVVNTDKRVADAVPRYQLLESPRAFALELLAASGEHDALRRRHALAMAALFDAAWDDYFSGRTGADDWVDRVAADLDNAREALAWAASAGDSCTFLAIGTTLLRALPASQHAERMALAERCRAMIEPAAPERLQQRAWSQLSLTWINTNSKRSHEAARHAVDLARAMQPLEQDKFALYLALSSYAGVAAHLGESEGAEEALREMRALEEPAWPAQRAMWGVSAEGNVASFLGKYDEALVHVQRLVALNVARGADRLAGSEALNSLIDAQLGAGNAAEAARLGAQVVATLEGTRHECQLAYARLNLTAAWLVLGNCAQARLVAQAGWPQAARFELQPYWADHLALLAALEGRPRAAAKLAGYADAANSGEDIRELNEAAAIHKARRIAREALGDEVFGRLHLEGTSLLEADIAKVLFAAEDV